MAGGKRAVNRGLSRIEPEDNTLVVYAAKDGTTADDGAGQRHSPFTQAILKHIATPGLEINFVFRRVRDDVVAVTSPVQTPHVYGTLGGKEFYLKPGAPSPASQAPAPSVAAEAARICREVEGMSNPATLAVLETPVQGHYGRRMHLRTLGAAGRDHTDGAAETCCICCLDGCRPNAWPHLPRLPGVPRDGSGSEGELHDGFAGEGNRPLRR